MCCFGLLSPGRAAGAAPPVHVSSWCEAPCQYQAAPRHCAQVALSGHYNATGRGSALAVSGQLPHGAGLPRPFLFVAVLTTTSTVGRRSGAGPTPTYCASGRAARFRV